MSVSPVLNEALRLADLGYPVFPCIPGSKKPITKHGLLDASTDPEQIQGWWMDHPDANVAMRTEGLIVVDLDGNDNPWLGDLDARWNDFVGVPSSITPRGGRHFLFRQPEGKAWRNTESRLAPKVDTRANGGYILVPPSVVNGVPYRWVEVQELEVAPDRLTEPPQWLIAMLDRLVAEKSKTTVEDGSNGQIVEGKRNATLTSFAGTMRRVGMHRNEIASALHCVNSNRCAPCLDRSEVDRIAESVAKYPPDQIAAAAAGGADRGTSRPLPPLRSAGDLIGSFPVLRDPVIHGLIRRGETMNVIAPPKTGKSWLTTDLALSVASGCTWLKAYRTERGSVLILDNELHGETSANRIPRVAAARNITLDEYFERLFIMNLRGCLMDIFSLGAIFDSLEPNRFKVIILDAFYRFMPPDTDENDNGAMARMYNQLDLYADRLGACFVLIHHTSKGNQSGKWITDVGAGAGSQSRATDTHLVLRPHEENGVVVLDAAVRSWPPLVSRCLQWQFPVWEPADDLDPTQLRAEKPKRKKEVEETLPEEEQVSAFVRQFVSEEPKTKTAILRAAKKGGYSERSATRLLRAGEQDEIVHRWSFGSNRPVSFATKRKPSKEEKANGKS